MIKRTLVKEILKSAPGQRVTVGGWVRTRRDSKGGFSFIEVNDGSCFGNLQVLAPDSLDNYTSEVLKLHPGASVLVDGELVASPGKGQAVELSAGKIQVLGFCDPMEYPLGGKSKISFERLREVAHLRARTNTFGAIARVRNELGVAVHKFFQERDFYYFNAPIITASDCEGAGEMFQVTTLNLDKPPRTDKGEVDFNQDFFGRKANLTVSGQLEGETYACALGKIYTFGPTFRAENSNTSRHLAEFWMIEPEVAFADLEDNAQLAEDFLRYCLKHALEKCGDDLAFFNDRIEKGLIDTLAGIVNSDFVRVDYTEAIELLQKADRKFEFPVYWGCDMQYEHERYLAEQLFKRPVIVMNYPKEIKAFYMRQNDDGKTVAAMDVLVPKVGEIIGGSQREERIDILEGKIKGMNFPLENYWWYLDLRRFGGVPHAGFGLGFERMVQFVTGMGNIRDVIPYPRFPRGAEF